MWRARIGETVMTATPAPVIFCAAAALLMGALVGDARQTGGRGSAPWPAGLVRADIVVTDAGGQAVKGLTQGDFDVRVDGEPRPVQFFSSEASSLTLVILVDVTASLHLCPAGVAGIPSTAGPRTSASFSSMRRPGLIPPAVPRFRLEGIGNEDRVRVGAIGRTLKLSDRFTADSSQLGRDWGAVFGLPPIEWLGPSPIHDAVFEAVTLAAAEPGRRAVIVVTDGQASGNRHGYREVAELAARTGVSVSTVAEGILTATNPMRPFSDFGIDLTRDLKTMADLTGGVLIPDPGVWNQEERCYRRVPADYLGRVIATLRGGYVLGFVAVPAAGASATLDVRVNRPGVVVHARRSFGQ